MNDPVTVRDPGTIPINQMFLTERLDWGIDQTLYYTFLPIGDWHAAFLDDWTVSKLATISVGVLVIGVLGTAFGWGSDWRASGVGQPRYGAALIPASGALTAHTFNRPGPGARAAVRGVLRDRLGLLVARTS